MNDKIIREVYEVLESRRDNPIDSYTSKIMQNSDKKAEDKILEKIAVTHFLYRQAWDCALLLPLDSRLNAAMF